LRENLHLMEKKNSTEMKKLEEKIKREEDINKKFS